MRHNDPEDQMPCGNCVVCGEPLDFADAGFCIDCQGGFHWGRCGGWSGGVHRCASHREDSDA